LYLPGPAIRLRCAFPREFEDNRAFLFFNNYLRNYALPEQKSVQVRLKLPSEEISIPSEPVDIPSQSSFFWPVNLDLNGALLKYATAQPFATLADGKDSYYFFVTSPNANAEFASMRRPSIRCTLDPVTFPTAMDAFMFERSLR